MKINIANPSTGGQKLFDIDDDKKLRIFYEKRISAEVDASPLGEQFKGYVLRITGGNDKQGFPMKQGVLTNTRVRLLLKKGSGCFRRPTHAGERKRRTVRGCIVGSDLSVLNTIIVQKGPAEIPGLTDVVIPRRLGPKRASKIRKLFNLSKEDDVRKYVVRREVQRKSGHKKVRSKAPRIQRLVTSVTLQRKHKRIVDKKKKFEVARAEAAEYAKLLATRKQEQTVRHEELVKKRQEAARKIRKLDAKKRTRVALKKIFNQKKRSITLKSKYALTNKTLKPEQLRASKKAHSKFEKKRLVAVHKLVDMRAGTVRKLAKARIQLNKYPSTQSMHNVQKLRNRAHELYLRIMSGGRLPNLRRLARQQEKRNARRLARISGKKPAAKRSK